MLSVAVKWSLFDHLWYDHLFDHLSLWSLLWSFVDPKHGFVPKRGFVDETSSDLTPRNGRNRKNAARLLGVAPFRMCPFPSGKGWYHGMEPRYLLMLKHFIYDCVMLMTSAQLKVPKDRGWHTRVSCYLVWKVTRPCVGRDPVRFSGRPSRGVSMWQWEVPWPNHSLEIQRNNTILYGFSCRTCFLRR